MDKTTKRWAGVLAAAAAAMLAACSTPAPKPSNTPNDDALASYYQQDLEFGPCDDFALTDAERATYEMAAAIIECGRLDVPVDYDRPEAESASIAVLRVPAQGSERIGSLVLNPGGPGQGGASYATLVAGILAQSESPVLQHFDIVGFDPRGVGASTPAIDCFTDEQRDADDDLTMPTLLPSGNDWTDESAQEFADACAERSGGDAMLANLGTRDVARDMDVLRAALGDEQLTYAGWSYGTRLGAVYAEMFPENVRAMALDGVMNPIQNTFDRSVDQARGFQSSFDKMAKWCAEETDACPLGTDPTVASAAFQQILVPLKDAPVPAGDGRTLDYDGALLGTVAALYSSINFPTLVNGLTEIQQGRGDVLLTLRNTFSQRNPDGSYNGFLEALMAINCIDEDRHDAQRETQLREAVAEVAPAFDDGDVVSATSPCAAWPGSSELGFPYADEVDTDSLADLLIVSVTGDPATPHDGAIQLAEQLASPLLTVNGEQHGAMFVGGSACVDEIVSDYLVDLTPPPSDANCSL
ncbi:alpha/beta hydrolase [Arenivirga flava]|uniref:Alpha/beta hydrolase n=1 Tax=Arenivirga flava TaxID=1930060 RepID=A0AA37UQ10_9MICO|nr:alpha/beta hydrolase [Arenivirga flava]GMA28866.1 alpha/beta hydrolase [Arenivirga flava]